MKKRMIIALAVLNAVLAVAVLSSQAVTQAVPFAAFRDCCKEDGAGVYCCESCCYFISDCDFDGDCVE